MVLWRGRPDTGPDFAILASFRATRRQALGRRLGRAWPAGAVAVPLLFPQRWAAAGAVACLATAVAGVLRGGADAAVEVDDRGVRPVPGALPRIGWEEVVDVYAERYGRRTVAALRLDSGAAVRLPAPYDGCLLAHDPAFEGKLFTLRQLWETHRRWRR
jgi:hypothetical protein